MSRFNHRCNLIINCSITCVSTYSMYLLYPFTSILHLFGVTWNGSSHSFSFFFLIFHIFILRVCFWLICIDICFYLCFFFFVAAITIRRWKYKRVPVTIVSMYCSKLQIYCPPFTSISVRLFLSCMAVLAELFCGVNCLKSSDGGAGRMLTEFLWIAFSFPGLRGITSAPISFLLFIITVISVVTNGNGLNK